MTDPQQQNDEHQRFRARMDYYLAELEAIKGHAGPYHELRLEAFKAAAGYAQAALKAGFILNGGALIAIPAFRSMISPVAHDHWFNISNVLASFVVGIVFCTVSVLFAFLSANNIVYLTALQFDYTRDLTIAQFRSATTPGAALPDETSYLKSARRFQRCATGWRVAAISSGICSLGLFVVGAICAYQMFQPV